MSDRPQNEEPRSISEAAADWLVLIRAGEMTEQEKLDYIHWLKESPEHIREILELVNLEQLLRETHAEPSESETPADEASKVIDLAMPTGK
ncbi:FecR/PupR family sigma factor regulator [Peristeroidobacter agariperforans]|uniref:FecR/PupR family sigma factor regulator n=1 Tax=Peristeroidobacter agariperforans TaxID=268404 RepID=UPI00101D0482|nr:FecR/PupR family sigma factor regulator [Peristeroidobacter agariperforans]